jgi:glutaredoxin
LRPLKNTQFCSRSRKVKILTTGIPLVFRGLRFESDAEIGQKGAFFKGLTFTQRKGEVNMENDVKLYSLSTCSHCKATKKFLGECNVKYEFTDVDLTYGEERAAILEDIKKLNPQCSFPTIIIGDKVIVGFKEDEIREALGL